MADRRDRAMGLPYGTARPAGFAHPAEPCRRRWRHRGIWGGPGISRYSLVERPCLDAVEHCRVAAEHDLRAAHGVDEVADYRLVFGNFAEDLHCPDRACRGSSGGCSRDIAEETGVREPARGRSPNLRRRNVALDVRKQAYPSLPNRIPRTR